MKCLKCQNNIEHEMPCIFCKNIFCSYKCLRSHMIFAHNNNLLIKTPRIINKSYQNTNNKQSKNKTVLVQSPYLIQGIYYRKRNYDEKYNLENFIPIFEDDKPKVIGGGSFGQVFLVINTKNNKLYAIKHMSKLNLSKKLNSLESIYKEIYIQSRIDHPNILPILYERETNIDFDLVLEYAKGGSLFHYIRRRRYLDENLAFSLFIQVVNAVYFLHKNDLIHRDIKPENILIFENNIIKLCDFGWCVKLEEGEQRGTFCGTTEYMSPELVNHEEYSKEIDIWSLGVLLYEMVHGYSPFRPDKPNFNAKDVINNIRMHRLKFDKNISTRCKDLIYHLLDEEPEKRYKIEDIFSSDFVKYYENKNFSFPDKFLIEKYKFKISKAQNVLYPTIKNEMINLNRSKAHNKSSSNITSQRSNILIEENEFDNNISIIKENKSKVIKNLKREVLPPYLSEENLLHFKLHNNKKDQKDKKLEKTKSFEYFPPMRIIDNKINISLMGNPQSSKHQENIKKSYNIHNSYENKNNNQIIDKNDIIQVQEIPKNETKIKTIIINNYFPNVIQTNEYKKNNNETKNDLNFKKNSHIKPLKISKIPTSKKFNKINLNFSKKKLDSFIHFNYLMIKNHLSPKIRLINESKKLNNLSKEKNSNSNVNKSKIIEVNRANYNHSSKILGEILCHFNTKPKENKKIITRNVLNYKYDSMKDNNYDSRDNHSKLSTSYLNTKNITNNKSYSNFYYKDNNEVLYDKRKKDVRIHHTKLMNLLNLNYKNTNNKSFFSSKNKKKIYNNSVTSENRSLLNTIEKNNRAKGNKIDLNLYGIKKVKTSIFRTKQNSPLNTFNNNFVHTIINKNKIIENKNKVNISHSNNISSLNIYDFNKNKNLEKGKMQLQTKNLSQLEIHNNKSIIIPKGSSHKNKNNETYKKIKNIPIMKTSKRNDKLYININNNNIIKSEHFEKCESNEQNNHSDKKTGAIIKSIFNKNKNVLKCITRNNSNRIIDNEKFKLMKKLELNKYLTNLKSNKNKRINYKIKKEYSFNNSNNKMKNKSFINSNKYIETGNKENEQFFINGSYKNIYLDNKLTSSRNVRNYEDDNNLKTSNNHYDNNKVFHRTNFNNLNNRIRVIIRKDPKTLSTSTIPRYKSGLNRVINNEITMNKLNFENKYSIYKRIYNGAINKTENNSSILDKDDYLYCICHH